MMRSPTVGARRALVPALALASLALGTAPRLAGAQGIGAPTLTSEGGLYAETYSISGRDARRPSSTLRFHFTPSLEWMGMQVGGTLLWSTEERFTAQSTNRFYLAPRWSWGQVHAGDYVPEISRYSASAAQVRGGGIELTPGRFRLAATAGRAQAATDLSLFDAAQERWLTAGLVGWGDRTGTFIELSALRAADRVEGSDTVSVPPQENLVGGLAAGVRLLDGALTVKGEAGGSLFSRDRRADPLDSLDLPEASGSLFTPRVSSRWDYAWNVETRLAGRRGSLGAQVEYVGPGFTTLGNPYFQNDRREYRLLGSIRALGGRLHANASLGRRTDNLAGDKRATTRRTTGSATVVAVTGSWLVSTATVLVNGMSRRPDLVRRPTDPEPVAADSFRLANVVLAFTVTEQLRFERWGLPQHLVLTVAEQRVNDDSPRYGNLLDATSRSVAVEYGMTLAGMYAITLRPAWQSFDIGGERESFTSVTGGIARRAQRSPLALSVASTYTPVAAGSQMRQELSASYRLGESTQFGAQLRHQRLSGANGYDETTASLRLSRRW